MKRKRTGLSGLLAIDKPCGMSSHDVVNAVRRITGERRVGHAGTLDPAASGLLLVGVGSAARLSNYLTGHDKTYTARIVFGVATDTDDCCGRALRPPASAASMAGLLDEATACETLAGLVGKHMQLPPAYSAIKKNGVTAYKAAREGNALELERRAIEVYSAQLQGVGSCEVVLEGDGEGTEHVHYTGVYWDVALAVSKGTYIRAIARDLGAQMGCGAHLGALRRERIAGFSVEAAVTLEQLEQSFGKGAFPWCDPVAALGFPQLALTQEQLPDVRNGRTLADAAECGVAGLTVGANSGVLAGSTVGAGLCPPVGDDAQVSLGGRAWARPYKGPARAGRDDSPAFVSCTYGGKLLAVYEAAGDVLKPATVFADGVQLPPPSSRAALAASPRGASSRDPEQNASRSDAPISAPIVIAIGVFDGLHLGHQSLIGDAYANACELGARLVIVTFDPDPDEFFRPEHARSRKLMSNVQRLNALGQAVPACGVKVLPGTAELFSVEPELFLEGLARLGCVKAIHVGQNFRFGVQAKGDTKLLASWCAAQGIACCVHELVEWDGAVVSATRIRELLLVGEVREAARLLGGRLHRVVGTCTPGRGEGTGLGFATANLTFDPGSAMLPAEGVYAAYTSVAGVRYASAVNVGVAASFEEATAPVEAHLLGFEGKLYGQRLAIDFVEYLRPQRKFDQLDELVATVTADIEWVRGHLGGGE